MAQKPLPKPNPELLRQEYGLTTKQAQFVSESVGNPRASDVSCALKAGYSESSALNAHRIRAVPAVQNALEDLFAKSGLTRARLVAEIESLVRATKDGQPDNMARLRALELWCRLLKLLDSGINVQTSVHTEGSSALTEATQLLARYQAAVVRKTGDSS